MTTIEAGGLSQFIDGWARGAAVPRDAGVLRIVSNFTDLEKWTSEICEHSYDEQRVSFDRQCPYACWVRRPDSFRTEVHVQRRRGLVQTPNYRTRVQTHEETRRTVTPSNKVVAFYDDSGKLKVMCCMMLNLTTGKSDCSYFEHFSGGPVSHCKFYKHGISCTHPEATEDALVTWKIEML